MYEKIVTLWLLWSLPLEQNASVQEGVIKPSWHPQVLQTSNGEGALFPLHWAKLRIQYFMSNIVQNIIWFTSYNETLHNKLRGTRGPMGLDPGGHFLRHPRTPLQSAPPAPTMQCWVPGLHVRKEHAWV